MRSMKYLLPALIILVLALLLFGAMGFPVARLYGVSTVLAARARRTE